MSDLIPLVPYVIHQIANPVTVALMSVEVLKTQHLVKDEALAPAIASLEEVRRWLWVWRRMSASSAAPSPATWINLRDELQSILFFLEKSTLKVEFNTQLGPGTAFCFASSQDFATLLEGAVMHLHSFSQFLSICAFEKEKFFCIQLRTIESLAETRAVPLHDQIAFTPKTRSLAQLQRLAKRSLAAKITVTPDTFQIDIPVI